MIDRVVPVDMVALLLAYGCQSRQHAAEVGLAAGVGAHVVATDLFVPNVMVQVQTVAENLPVLQQVAFGSRTLHVL